MKIHPPIEGNQLLARFPRAEYDRLLGQFETLDLASGQVLYEAKSLMEYAYFPLRGTLSAVTVMLDGSMIEVATIGNEGAVGVPPMMRSDSPNRVFVQVPGAALRIGRSQLEKEVERSEPLKRLLLRYHTAFLFQVSQSVACNGLHTVQQRCCRWLLMSHDRVPNDEINLTHEFLAAMLGVRRASVTEVLRPLQEQGLVKNSRGEITVLDRAGLEAASCECYLAVRDEYERLLEMS